MSSYAATLLADFPEAQLLRLLEALSADFMAREAFGAWSYPSANKALARAARLAQLPAFTVYAIRHSFAAGLRRTGADVADIQDLYGHTNPSTTMIYAPPRLVKHRAAIARLRVLESEARGNGWQY